MSGGQVEGIKGKMDKGGVQFDSEGGNQNKNQSEKQTERSEKNKSNKKQRKKGMEAEIKKNDRNSIFPIPSNRKCHCLVLICIGPIGASMR